MGFEQWLNTRFGLTLVLPLIVVGMTDVKNRVSTCHFDTTVLCGQKHAN